MMLFSYALLCFVLASTASAAGPANPGPVIAYGTLHNMVATGTKRPAYDPAKLTKIEDLKPKLEEGHVYSVCRRVAVSWVYDLKQSQKFDRIVAGFTLQPQGQCPGCLHWSSPRIPSNCLRVSF